MQWRKEDAREAPDAACETQDTRYWNSPKLSSKEHGKQNSLCTKSAVFWASWVLVIALALPEFVLVAVMSRLL